MYAMEQGQPRTRLHLPPGVNPGGTVIQVDDQVASLQARASVDTAQNIPPSTPVLPNPPPSP